MDRATFEACLRDALNDIFDHAALDKNPLAEVAPRSGMAELRADHLRRFIENGIEALKPKTVYQIDAMEWRYYLTLTWRYIEGLSSFEIQNRLALGERQERRLRGRAMETLEELLWNRLSVNTPTHPLGQTTKDGLDEPDDRDESNEGKVTYPITLESLRLDQLVEETAQLFMPRLQAQNVTPSIQIDKNLPKIHADRIILRQIILHLANSTILTRPFSEMEITAHSTTDTLVLEINTNVIPPLDLIQTMLADTLLVYWIERLNARLGFEIEEEPDPLLRFFLQLPRAKDATIFVVDDHEAAIRIIQRHLSQTNINVFGITETAQVCPLARNQHPQLILLDVMMPSMDGWEILQKIKSDPEIQDIPVYICSVWNQPDLAFSLGAQGFIKKPVQKDELMAVLAQLNLPGI